MATGGTVLNSLTLRPMGDDDGSSIRIAPGQPWTVGRGVNSATRLTDSSVSKDHAVLQCVGGIWRVADAGSLNGTYRNGERLEEGKPTVLCDGDVLGIGKCTFRVIIAGSSAARTPPPGDRTATYATRATIFLRLRDDDRDVRELGWEEFRQRYAPVIVGFARNAGLRPQDTEDVLQDVMMGFFQVSSRFEYDPSKGRFRGYLKRAVLNAIRKRLRQPGSITALDLDIVSDDGPSSDAAWEKQWADQIMARAIDEVRSRFDARTLDAFELYARRDVPADAVAERLGLAVNSVYQAKARVLRAVSEVVARLRAEEG